MNEENKDYLYQALCEVFDEQYHQLIYKIIYEISNYVLKSEIFLFESLIRKIIQRNELLEQAKNTPYVINTSSSIKVHPVHKAIVDLEEQIRILNKDLGMSKVSLKQYSTQEQLQDIADSKITISSVDLILVSLQGVDVPKEVEKFIDENGNEVKKSELIKFCKENDINSSFLKYIKQAE